MHDFCVEDGGITQSALCDGGNVSRNIRSIEAEGTGGVVTLFR